MSELEEAVVDRNLSVLGNLKERRQKVVEAQVLSLPVPRWTDPNIVVKYKPVDHEVIRQAQQRVEAAPANKKASVEVDANADVLIRGCLGVVGVVDGEEYSLREGDPNGEPTLFDADLANSLGLGKSTARQVVRALFIAEGDIISAAGKLGQWSGYREAEADESLSGE